MASAVRFARRATRWCPPSARARRRCLGAGPRLRPVRPSVTIVVVRGRPRSSRSQRLPRRPRPLRSTTRMPPSTPSQAWRSRERANAGPPSSWISRGGWSASSARPEPVKTPRCRSAVEVAGLNLSVASYRVRRPPSANGRLLRLVLLGPGGRRSPARLVGEESPQVEARVDDVKDR